MLLEQGQRQGESEAEAGWAGCDLPEAQSLSLLLTMASASLAGPGSKVASEVASDAARSEFAFVMWTDEEEKTIGRRSLMRGIRDDMVSSEGRRDSDVPAGF